eukprot:6425415-Pyramimonas_sp.AAC.1
MEYWLGMGWSGRQLRHWYSLRRVMRDDAGNIIRSKVGQAKSQGKKVKRDLKRATIEDRKLYRGVCCTCPSYAGRRLGCPIRRPSRSPDSKKEHRGL